MRWLTFVLGRSRGLRNALTRLPTILHRFGLTSRKIDRQLEILLSVAERHEARITLPVTAVTALRHPDTVRHLQERGVELAAHGYVHNDYSALSASEQTDQVRRARETLADLGVRASGWRCPYSRWNEATIQALKAAGFEYDATPVYAWPVYAEEGVDTTEAAMADYERLCRLFSVRDTRQHIVLPTMVDNLVQIPMSIPQDEDMVDRLHLDSDAMTGVWTRVLQDAHDRGELFVMCLHPERASLCAEALDGTLTAAQRMGDVWVATLGEIADWWRRRNQAEIVVESIGENRWEVAVHGPAQLEVICNGTSITGPETFVVHAPDRPVIQCGPQWPREVQQRLRDAGYVVEQTRDVAPASALDLDEVVSPDTPPDGAVRSVAAQGACLVRVLPWPVGFRACLSITGDLDALTLYDFAMRLREF